MHGRPESLVAPRGILFDLDGTLSDRAAGLSLYSALFANDFRESLDHVDAVDVETAILAVDDNGALPRRQLVTVLVSALAWRSPVSSQALFLHWNERFGTVSAPFDDVAEVIDTLERRRIPMGIVSNGAPAMQRSKIAALGLTERMAAIVISEEVGMAKPDPAIFHLAADRLGIAARDAWFVGDHPVADVGGAEGAGITAFWVETGMSLGAAPPPRRPLRRLGDLLTHLP